MKFVTHNLDSTHQTPSYTGVQSENCQEASSAPSGVQVCWARPSFPCLACTGQSPAAGAQAALGAC